MQAIANDLVNNLGELMFLVYENLRMDVSIPSMIISVISLTELERCDLEPS